MNKMIQKNIHKMFGRVTAFMLAFVMTLTLMPIMSGTTVMAATDFSQYVSVNAENTSWDFTVANVTELKAAVGEYDFSGIVVAVSVAEAIRYNKGTLDLRKTGATVKVPVPAGRGGTLTIVANSADANRILYLNTNGSETFLTSTSGTGSSLNYTASDVVDGYITLVPGGSSLSSGFKIKKLSITPAEVASYGITCTNDGNGSASATVDDVNVTEAEKDKTVTITATPNSGYEFSSWEVVSGGVTLADSSAATTTFTMPEEAVEIRANFAERPKYNVTITSNTSADLEGATLTFTDEDGGTFVRALGATTPYTVQLPTGTYTVAVSKAGLYQDQASTASFTVTESGGSVAIQFYTYTLVDLTGTVTGLSADVLANLELIFTVPAGKTFKPEFKWTNQEAGTFELKVESGVETTVSAAGAGINDYVLSTTTINKASNDTQDIEFTGAPTYSVTLDVQNADASSAKVTFTNKADNYTYQFNATDTIKLRAGTYTSAITGMAKQAVVVESAPEFAVSDSGENKCTVTYKSINSWDFATLYAAGVNVETIDGKNYIAGIETTNGAKNNTYLLVSTGTLEVPNVKKGDKVTFSYCYAADFKVGDETASTTSGSTATIETKSFIATEDSLTATINGTTYLTGISVTPASAISVTPPTNGSVTTDVTAAVEGTTVTITATPNKGYEVAATADVKAVYGASSTDLTITSIGGGQYTFEMPAEAVTVSVTFTEIPKNIITINSDPNGSVKAYITVDTVETEVTGFVERDTVVTLKATASDGYGLSALEVKDSDDTPVEVTDNTFVMPAKAVTVTPTFTEGKFTVTVNPTEHGSVAPVEGEKTVGTKITLEITPDTGYVVDTIKVVKTDTDEEVTVNMNDYSFTMPLSNVTVTVTFKQPTYAITVGETTKGTVQLTTADGNVTSGDKFIAGTEVTIAATPSEGCAVKSIVVAKTGDPETTVTVTDNKFAMPAYDVTVTVTFKSTVPTVKTWKADDHKNDTSAVETDGFKLAAKTVKTDTSRSCSDFTAGLKMESASALKFTVAEGKYARVSVSMLSTGDYEASLGIATSIGFNAENKVNAATFVTKDDKTVVVTTNKIRTATETAQTGIFDCILPGGTYYIVNSGVATGGKQAILYQVNVAEYDDEADVPPIPVEATVSVSGKITSDYDLTGAKVILKGEKTVEAEIVKAVEGYEYTAEGITVNDTYEVSISSSKLFEDKKYIESLSKTSVEVAETDITDADITVTYKNITNVWDFTLGKYELTTIQKKTGTYKGLAIDATDTVTYSDPKFAVQNNRVQVNPAVKVTIPVEDYAPGTVTVTFSGDASFTLGTSENTTTTYAFDADTKTVDLITTGANPSYLTKIELAKEGQTNYTITVEPSENGTVTASVDTAAEGDEVTLAVTPAEGYVLDTLTVNDGAVTVTDNKFVMPAGDVTVKATFKASGSPDPDPDPNPDPNPDPDPGKTPDEEKVNAFVNRLYSLALGREADEAGLAAWAGVLTSQESNSVDVGFGFVFSPENADRQLSDEEFVEMLYLTFMDRPSDEGGKAAWVSQLEAGVDREKVFEGFVMSDEFKGICDEFGITLGSVDDVPAMKEVVDMYRNQNADVTKFVARCYSEFLGRGGDPDGIEAWCKALITKENTPKEVASVGFIASGEFQERVLTDEEYVTLLYSAFLGREADPAGLEAWVNTLVTGENDRETILDGFVDSVEFAEILTEFGLAD